MSYEETVRAKHEFEDAFKEVLQLLSVMDRRELELAAAKLGDGLQSDDLIDDKSALLSARIIQMILALRSRGELAPKKMSRLWMRRKKKAYVNTLASLILAPENERYSKEMEKVKAIRNLEIKNYYNQFAKWEKLVKTLPLWRRLFKKPPRPGWPKLTPIPVHPRYHSEVAQEISGSKNFGEILVDMVYYFKYPNIQYSDDYVKEENVRATAIELLEYKE